MSNIISFNGTPREKPPTMQEALGKASKADLEDVLILGWDSEGMLYNVSSMNRKDALWLLEVYKSLLIESAFQES